MSLRIFFSFSLIIFTAQLFAADPLEALFLEANEAFDQGDYPTAIALYDSVYAQGYESITLYYNMGNAYFKNGELAQAIRNYERVIKFDPDHEDALYNLRLANLRVVDNIEPVPDLLFSRWGKELLNSRSSSQWAIISIITLWLSLLAVGLLLYNPSPMIKRISFFASIIFLLMAISSVSMGLRRLGFEKNSKAAIIYTPNAYVKSGPSNEGTDLFILHEGVKVSILEESADWLRIKLVDGKVGWVPENVLLRI